MLRFLRIERPTTATERPTSTRDVDRLLHPVDVRGEAGDEDPPVPLRDDLAERLADDALGLREAGPLGVRRVAEQEVDAAVAERRRARRRRCAARRPACGRASSRPYGRPARPRSRSKMPTASGTECDMRTNSMLERAELDRGPCQGASRAAPRRSARPCSSSFDFTRPSVSRVARTVFTRTSRKR